MHHDDAGLRVARWLLADRRDVEHRHPPPEGRVERPLEPRVVIEPEDVAGDTARHRVGERRRLVRGVEVAAHAPVQVRHPPLLADPPGDAGVSPPRVLALDRRVLLAVALHKLRRPRRRALERHPVHMIQPRRLAGAVVVRAQR